MHTFDILLQQIGLFIIYILAGMILVRTRVLSRETLGPISKFCLENGTSGDGFYQHYRWGRAAGAV